ncbi:MAG: autotransporter domain-containing protein [Phascolarctobacterium sp.]|uniref:autotransporter family protein n=1 Tax=Phascolarctobacterium sp. TaxID=2049039 RepID=UPI0026DBB2B7|nr:autotransporter outer membrane beta-barrel domain-containing protein [Phascolarctobacterium sp.]MDO4921618.1 autotransporter domain-containing protein [Phascolarctobacterium sp.]
MKTKLWQKSLTLGALMACVITGSALAAEYNGQIFDEDVTGYDVINATIGNNKIEGYDNRDVAIGASGQDVTVEASTINIRAEIENGTSGGRLYGIDNTNSNKLTVSADSINLDLAAAGTNYQLRAIRNVLGEDLIINADVNGEISLSSTGGGIIGYDVWGNITQNGSVNMVVNAEEAQLTGVQVVGQNVAQEVKAVFNDDFIFAASGQNSKKDVCAVYSERNGTTEFNGNTYITAKAENSIGAVWVNALQTNGSIVNFNGDITELAAENDNYTAQTINTYGYMQDYNNYPNGIVNFNSSGHTYLVAKSAYGVNCVGYGRSTKPNEVNFNGGDVILHAIITDGVATSNAIGILGGDNTTVSDKVNNFSIIVEGAGVDKNNMNYSNGTAGIYEDGGKTVINAHNLNINVTSGQDTENTIFDKAAADALGDDYCTAYGIRVDLGGSVEIGRDTTTNISVTDNYKNAIGIYVSEFSGYEGYGSGSANILGDVSIDATGGEGTYSVASKDSGNVILGSTGKTVSLTGDVIADQGTITLQGSDNTVNGVITSTNSGEINLTGEVATYNLQHMEASDSGTITVGAGTTIAVDSANIVGDNYLVTVSNNGALDVAADSKIHILNAEKGQTFNIVDGSDKEAWKVENISADNFMLQYKKVDGSDDYIITTTVADAKEVFGGAVLIPDVLTQTLTNGKDGDAAYDFFNDAVSGANLTKAAAAKNINNAASMSELAGVSRATYSASNILTDAVADHMSLAKNLDHDTDIWAHYVHTKENIDGLAVANGGARYDAQYNGIVVGADLYKQGKGTIGAALTYIDGKITGSTRNDAEYYGLSIYGGIENEDSAVIGDISYLHGKNDITQYNSGYTLTGEPKSDAFSVGVRAEQSFKAGAGKVVPYAGLRYMHLGTGNYTSSIGLHYDADDADLFLLPVGVKYSAEHKTAGWTLRPIAEVGYVWAMGDRDGGQTVSLNGVSNGFGYDVTDSGSYIGRLALEAEKANVTYGLGYEYQKGDSVKANKWMVNLNWAF